MVGDKMNKLFYFLMLLICAVSMTGCYNPQAVAIMNNMTMQEWMTNHTILYNAQTNTYIATVYNTAGQVVGGYLKWGLNGISYSGGVWYPLQRDVIIKEAVNTSGFKYIPLYQVPSNVVWYVLSLMFSSGVSPMNIPLFILPGNFRNPYTPQKTLVTHNVV